MTAPLYSTTLQPLPPAGIYQDPQDSLTPPTVSDVGTQPYTPPNVSPDMGGANWYTEGLFDGRYDADMGLLQMPVAGPVGTPAEIIRVHAPSEVRIVEWTVERVGAPPTAPSTATSNPCEVLSRRIVFPMTPTKSPDGTWLFRLSGRYEYLCIIPHTEQDRLSAGVPAWDQASPSDTDVMPGQWDQNGLNSASSIPAGFVPPTN